MITKEQEIKNKLKAKGILVEINEEGLHIEDEKSGDIEILSLDDLSMFVDKVVTISIADSIKLDIDDEEDGEEVMI